ncbi:primosomal protein N' [Brevibacillus formosus]|uniref:Replication restart protein PriA n=1 Tax=Brevibacillus formosus TaxID=54913 RepID=A0A837KWI5_9BACL|nr:primosomal protein N' [Brevibacillus formosus]KLI00920.1 primosomal protein DnaI [Brevibacillus formosus]MED1956083.1 primosomal protein N' [Brevibacillus formosus]PSK00403.1 primosomal protein N' [Brevibacillus formosus]GED58342.1 primosomal protein N' [Brevibacillus formosus]
MIAQIIVDVPVNRTNRPFDYHVPPWLRPLIRIGSRVVVPFGPRQLQGYVIGIVEDDEAIPDRSRLKDVVQVQDDTPPLTPELLKMSEWMSKQYLCPWVTAVQAMLPAVLKGKSEKWLTATDALDEEACGRSGLLWELFRKRQIPLSEVEKQFAEEYLLVPGWIQSGLLATEYQVRDRITRKQQSFVRSLLDEGKLEEAIGSLPARAEQMRRVLQLMLMHKEQSLSVQMLRDEYGITRSPLKSLESKGWIAIEQVEVYRDPYANRRFQDKQKPVFTPVQEAALTPILQSIESGTYASYLLHGVTGSGKTEVYLEAIERTLEKGREAIFLVPEISLTPQMVERFKARFGADVAVLHSALSQGERYDEWRKIIRNQVKVVVGARSAIFAPFRNVGLIVIDEEHESSYKQEETPRYHAREVALWRAKENQGVLVMGSATPALETYALATRGRYELLRMPERVGNRPMPEVHVVDMREELQAQNRSMFSRKLHEMIADRLAKEEQMVIFLNRRGFSTFVMCRSCGYTMRCIHCDISLTYHKTNHTARCHYCGYTIAQPKHCPECQSEHIRFFGTGTQKVEAELAKLFPGIRVIRMDVDTTSRKGSHEELLNKFRSGQGDVLLGTQMIAKGLDFPRVTLAGIIAADTSLHLPDFRAAEKTFQLLTQVGGRAGRHELDGDVVIQTYTPEHYSIVHATKHDYPAFYQDEMMQRRRTGYPPYFRLVLITFSHEEVPVVIRGAHTMADYLRQRLAQTTILLGPVASPIARVKDRFRFQIMLKYRDEPQLSDLLAQATAAFEEWNKQQKVLMTIDVDPYVLL